jgi:hypothetical protein
MTLVQGYHKFTSSNKPIAVDASGQLVCSVVNVPEIRDLTQATDSVLAYGFDGATNRKLKTDSDGRLVVEVNTTNIPIRALTASDTVTIIQGGGLTISDQTVSTGVLRSLSLGTTSTQVGTTSAICLTSIYLANNHLSDTRYVKFYNSASATSSDTPIMTFNVLPMFPFTIPMTFPTRFSTACCVRATTGVADNDNTAPTAGDVQCVIAYYQ